MLPCGPYKKHYIRLKSNVNPFFGFLSKYFLVWCNVMVMVEIIKDLCKKNGISLFRLEKEIGLGNGTIGKWGKFGRVPNYAHIKKVADYFHVPVSELTGEEQKESSLQIRELNKEIQEIIELYDKAAPELRVAALAVLKSGGATRTIQDAKGEEK